MINTVAEIRGWHIEEDWQDDLPREEWGTVRRLEENWKSFLKGNHKPTESVKRNRKERRLTRNVPPEISDYSDSE